MWKLLLPAVLAFGFVLAIPLFSYSPGYALVKSCFLTKIGPNAPKDVAYPAGCSGGNQKVLEIAKSQIGDPYVWGSPSRNWASDGDNPPSFDCSGLVGWSYYKATDGKFSMSGQTSADWNDNSGKFQKFTPDQKAQIQPGDIIYWAPSNVHHTALYEGPGGCPSGTCIIEAQQTGVPVKESDFESRISGSDPWIGFLRPKL